MAPLPGFVFRGDPDGAASLDRAFVFADPTADALGRVHIGQLQPHQQREPVSRCGRLSQRVVCQGNAAGADCDDSGGGHAVSINGNKIIPGCKPFGRQGRTFDQQPVARHLLKDQRAAQANRLVRLAGEDRLGADRTVFLADDAGAVHGPG